MTLIFFYPSCNLFLSLCFILILAGDVQVGISGVGYIWSVSEAEHDEEWRFSIAPIPKEKLEKFSQSAHDDNDEVNQDESSIPASGELIPDSDGTDFDGGVGEDYHDSADFENEVIVVCML